MRSSPNLPNFPLLFERIGNYLAKAPNASQEELEAAREALHTIVDTIYVHQPGVPCDSTHPKIQNG